MTITIEYCTPCGYEPRAASLAAEIRAHFPEARVELIPSGGGRFEVKLNDQPVFEKSQVGRHAAPGEIIRLLQGNG